MTALLLLEWRNEEDAAAMPISDYLRRVREKVGHELLLMPAVTALVFDEAGRLLLQHHGDTGRWVTPGGSVDPDESPSDAVVRELWEETGLVVEPVALAGVFGGRDYRVHYRNGDVVSYVMIAIECRVTGGALAPDGEESLELRWVSAGELLALPLAPWARRMLPGLVRSRDRAALEPATWSPPR
jgi:8-oxo-dGTP pyrophosphatase MutT (NUDIX family)